MNSYEFFFGIINFGDYMKVLTIKEPYASLIANNYKKYLEHGKLIIEVLYTFIQVKHQLKILIILKNII